MIYLWTAFLIGLVGSFHCAGMCGPIALALPLNKGSFIQRAGGSLLYNIGRTLTYMVLGAIFGLVGKGLHLAGFQLWSSIIIGSAMIIVVILPVVTGNRISLTSLSGGYSFGLIGRFQTMFRRGSLLSLFGIGLLNGILPCGLVYVGVAGALNTGAVMDAILFMAMFGLGTIPVMFSVSVAGNYLGLKWRNLIGTITPYMVVLIGVLFILRGLSLGIPYISPKAEALVPVVEKAHKCCHK